MEPILNGKLERTGCMPIPGYVLVQHDVIVTKLMSLTLVVFTQQRKQRQPIISLQHMHKWLAHVALTRKWQCSALDAGIVFCLNTGDL